MVFLDKLVERDIVLDPSPYPGPPYRLTLVVNDSGSGEEADPVPLFPGPDAKIGLLEKKEEPLVKPSRRLQHLPFHQDGCPDKGVDVSRSGPDCFLSGKPPRKYAFKKEAGHYLKEKRGNRGK